MNATGCDIDSTDVSRFPKALAAAKNSQYTVFVGGLDILHEGEGNDRVNISLPGVQLSLLQQLERASSSPLIVVILSGSSIDLAYLKASPRTGAILWGGYPGQDGGVAIAETLLGIHSPAGRLPITFYPAAFVDQVDFSDMNMRPGPHKSPQHDTAHSTQPQLRPLPPLLMCCVVLLCCSPGRGYRFYTGTPVFEFGAGLSYTSFAVSSAGMQRGSGHSSGARLQVHIQDVMSAAELAGHTGAAEYDVSYPAVSYEVTVTNTGSATSDVVVLGFLSAANLSLDTRSSSGISPPLSQLFNYERVSALSPGNSSTVLLTQSLSSLALFDEYGHSWLVPGVYEVWIGGTSDKNSAPPSARHQVELVGEMRQLSWAPLMGQQNLMAVAE